MLENWFGINFKLSRVRAQRQLHKNRYSNFLLKVSNQIRCVYLSHDEMKKIKCYYGENGSYTLES